jgi:uncharacterized protein involved in outer membrane biogenesis
MKKIIIRIGLGIVLLGIIALLVVFFSLDSIVKKGVETVGPSITKVDVKLGAAEISPFSGSGRLVKLFVGNPEGYKTPSAIEVGDIKVGVKLGSVTSDTIVVNEVSVKDAVITLEGSLTANNLTKILDNVNGGATAAPKPKGEPAQPGTSKSSKKFIVHDLLIDGAKVNLNLNVAIIGTQSMTVPIPTIHLQNIGEAEGGVTAEQLVQAIMKPLMSSVLTAATEQVSNMAGKVGDLSKSLGKDGAKTLDGATKGITDLFKKK